MLRWQEPTHCNCAALSLQASDVIVSTTEAGCQQMGASDAEVVGGPDPQPSGLLCLRHHLIEEGWVAIQVMISPFTQPSRLAMLSAIFQPALMWAVESIERRKLEECLADARERSHNGLLSLEAEREWLAYEVHDRVAQTLASVFQQLQAIESSAHATPQIRQIATRARLLTRETIREARSIMRHLHPPLLDEQGLAPLLEEELRHLQEDTGCKTRAELAPRLRVGREVEAALYRIFHEALTNIRRHSRATEVRVSLVNTLDGARLDIQDNGQGFDVTAALAEKRVGGLMSLHRRAELVGGKCCLESTAGSGTTVSVWVPWRGTAQGERT